MIGGSRVGRMRFTARQIILIVTLLLVGGGFRASTPFALGAEEDFLTDSEVDAVRDAQEPDKRLLLYLDIAQSRLEAARSLIAARKPGAGKAVQKRLAQYVKVLEALDETMQEAREKRAPLTKALAAIETRGTEFAKYLESLDD